MGDLLAGQTYYGRTIVTITTDVAKHITVIEYEDAEGTHYVTDVRFRQWLSEESYRQHVSSVDRAL